MIWRNVPKWTFQNMLHKLEGLWQTISSLSLGTLWTSKGRLVSWEQARDGSLSCQPTPFSCQGRLEGPSRFVKGRVGLGFKPPRNLSLLRLDFLETRACFPRHQPGQLTFPESTTSEGFTLHKARPFDKGSIDDKDWCKHMQFCSVHYASVRAHCSKPILQRINYTFLSEACC
jgi:hypothetical protein